MKKSRGLKKLEALAFEKLKEKRIGIPEHAIVKPKFKDDSANNLTKCVVETIKLYGGFASRINNVGIWDARLQKYRSSSTVNGFPDVTGAIFGRSINIEVKYKKDRMSPAQQKVKERIENSGGLYYVARDYESFFNWFESEVLKFSKEQQNG